jgi:RNA polymerase sigma-B factor
MSDFLSLHQDAEGLVLRYLKNPTSDLKDLIMVQYASMVERIARKFAGMEPFEDLVQVGFIGLLNALTKFDPEAGVRFNTYSTYLVAGEIKHYLRDRAQTIRHPAWLQELRHKVNKTAQMLQQSLGRIPTEREIADEVGVSEAAVKEVFQTQEMLRVASLDQAAQGDDDGSSEVEKLDAAQFCPEQLSVEDRVVLEHAMRQLRDLERQVLLHFHFDSMNQTEIAARLGISCNYVSHILRQSLAKLRKILSNEEEKDRVLRRQATTVDYDIVDSETGAYTDGYFRQRLEEEIHRSSGTEGHIALVLVNFKGLDSMRSFYGEQSVVDFMADAAEFFKSNVRRLDVVARFGKTGFGVILPSTGHNVALVRQRLLNKIANWLQHRVAATGGIVVEIGEACAPKQGRNGTELLAAAVLKPANDYEQLFETKKAS